MTARRAIVAYMRRFEGEAFQRRGCLFRAIIVRMPEFLTR